MSKQQLTVEQTHAAYYQWLWRTHRRLSEADVAQIRRAMCGYCIQLEMEFQIESVHITGITVKTPNPPPENRFSNWEKRGYFYFARLSVNDYDNHHVTKGQFIISRSA